MPHSLLVIAAFASAPSSFYQVSERALLRNQLNDRFAQY
jgi:hypothetical protein